MGSLSGCGSFALKKARLGKRKIGKTATYQRVGQHVELVVTAHPQVAEQRERVMALFGRALEEHVRQADTLHRVVVRPGALQIETRSINWRFKVGPGATHHGQVSNGRLQLALDVTAQVCHAGNVVREILGRDPVLSACNTQTALAFANSGKRKARKKKNKNKRERTTERTRGQCATARLTNTQRTLR